LPVEAKPQHLDLAFCPGFGHDRINFHQETGGDTAGQADPAWPNRAGCSTPCATMLGSGWGELGGGKAVAAQEHAGQGAVREALCLLLFVLCILLICIGVVTAFPLFAVWLNCPYPNPRDFSCFFPFSSAPQRGEGRQSSHVALLLPAITKL